MDIEFLKPILGVVVGFLLGLVTNAAKLMWDWVRRPRLSIDASEPLILRHETEVHQGDYLEERMYGFTVRNTGRRIARNVAFHLLKVEIRGPSGKGFHTISDHTFALGLYNAAIEKRGATNVTLVPNSAVLVHLATWREDNDAVFPQVDALPDYYDDNCINVKEYRFTVTAFGEDGEPSTAVVEISLKKPKPQ